MNDPLRRPVHEDSAVARGRDYLDQLRALDVSEEDLLDDSPAPGVDHEQVIAWLQNRGPLPTPTPR